MKKRLQRRASLIVTCVVGITAIIMGAFYFRYISRHIYEESTSHLAEIYSQVNYSFGAFIERNWGILDGWSDYIHTSNGKDSRISDFIKEQKQYWKFSGFYFISKDGRCITPEGAEDVLDFRSSMDTLIRKKEPLITNGTLSMGRAVTVFAVPVSAGKYRGFQYQAIALSYDNADLVNSLNVDAFSGESVCFIVSADGSVMLSTQSGGSVFQNYLTYLNAGSDLDAQELEQIRADWSNGKAGIVRFKIGETSHYLSYQPLGYQDCMVLGIVPESVASAGLLKIQEGTIGVLIRAFLLLGAVAAAQLIYHNRRQNKENRIKLQYRERMFDMLSNNVDDIFIMLDKETWQVDYISPNVDRLLGIPSEEAAKNIQILEKSTVEEVCITKDMLNNLPAAGSYSWEMEHVHQHTGERRWYRGIVYHENIQDVEKYVFVLSDRTKERQMNQNLQEALDAAKSANKAKSHFLSNMSHDIRTPMNAIVGLTVLLARDAGREEKVREYTRKITSSSRHLLGLINDVLDMSKIESGKTSLNVEQFSLSELIEELNTILQPQAKAKQQTFETHMQGCTAVRLIGDKLRLNQILINLLSNAVKYTPSGGKVAFCVQELPQSSPQYAHLRFVVRDNGLGMSEEFMKTVFEPFSREITSATNAIQGTGLGMAITKNLVDLMGGVIHVESRLGEGSVFTVELSFAIAGEQAEPEETDGSGQEEHPMRGLMFLVAEDIELNAEILSEMLDMEGARCEIARNGEEAVKMFSQSEPGYYDGILMDVQMPVLNGYDATRKIRACGHPQAACVLIVAMTANAFAEDVQNALESGMNGHLSKPVDMDALRNTVWKLGIGTDRYAD